MLPDEREILVLNLLDRHGIATVTEISAQCNCTPQTVRRDLRRLEDKGLVKRIYGGALPANGRASSTIRPSEDSMLETRTALIDQVDVLIVTPNETTATRRLIQRAQRIGIPIIAEAFNYPGTTSYVAINDYQAGIELGQWVASYAQRHFGGKIVALDVAHPLPNTESRSRGFGEGLRMLPQHNRKVIRADGQGLRETARQIVADALVVHTDVNVIFGVNDDSALGALDAYRAKGLDESKLLVVGFGFEGKLTKDLMVANSPYKASMAMFPELAGQICIDAAICAFHGCPLPDRIFAPYTLITAENLSTYYHRDGDTGAWHFDWNRGNQIMRANPAYNQIASCTDHSRPLSIGFLQFFSSHEWYQNMVQTMRERTRELGLTLKVIDLSHDVAHEGETLKRTIGHVASRLVNEGDTIILDAGVTTAYLAHYLRDYQDITVITNSLPVLNELEGIDTITLISSGGLVRNKGRSLIGAGAEASFRDMRADKAFIACTGISLGFGLSNTNLAEASVKQEMIEGAHEVILLADNTKFGVDSLVKVAPIESVHKVVTDTGTSMHDQLAFTQKGIEMIIAE